MEVMELVVMEEDADPPGEFDGRGRVAAVGDDGSMLCLVEGGGREGLLHRSVPHVRGVPLALNGDLDVPTRGEDVRALLF